MQHLAATSNFVSSGEMKELGRLRSGFMREKCEDIVFCPKPRKLGLATHTTSDLVRPIRWHLSSQPPELESEPGVEILDILLSKSGCGDPLNFGCSPPYFIGSPPSRADNPLIRDVQFIHQRVQPSPSSLSKSKPLGRPSFGPNAAVRVEGFDCSSRDTRCSIPALA